MYLISDGGINTNVLDTVEAIMLTKNLDYLNGVKLDVRKTIDNIFVLSKYNDLSKLTFSKNKVNECNYQYLRKVKFPSHIFKYYIPTLEEILKNYNNNKIIVIELFESNNLKDLYHLLSKYNYQYYFMSKEKDVLNELEKHHFNNIGEIINEKSNIKIKHYINNTFLIIKK